MKGLRIEPLSWGLLALAVGSVGWAHWDGQRSESATATLVSSRSAAWRLLPELASTDSAGATIELHPGDGGDPVRLVPQGLSHELWVGEAVAGPADPEAVAGLWDSLRMATTLRAAEQAADDGLGSGGRIVVELPQGGVRTIVLGATTPDGVGRYGAIEGGAEGTAGRWVLEQELATLVDQAPLTWLARRAAVIEPADVQAIAVGEARVARGVDGRWRGRSSDQAPLAWLDRVAVEARIDRLVSSRLDPLVDPQPDRPAAPWATIEGADGRDFVLSLHGECPGHEGRVLIDRGLGTWGCIDAAVVEPWPVLQMLDPALVPYGYGRILRVEQRRPSPRTLSRHGSGWRLEEPSGERTQVFDVEEAEVYRWVAALRDAEVEPVRPSSGPGESEPPEPAWATELLWTSDSTATLRLRCTAAPIRCRRDDGPWLQLRGAALTDPPPLRLDGETFTSRQLLSLASSDVRAIEILPGSETSAVVRQSAHFDLGVWRLDAPATPVGDRALDDLRLEGLLGALGALRAQRWVPVPDSAPIRTITVERIVARGQAPQIAVALYDDCVVSVGQGRAARVSAGACDALHEDLLVPMPLERAVIDATQIELRRPIDAPKPLVLHRRGSTWIATDGGVATEASRWLAERSLQAVPRLRHGAPLSPVGWSLRVRPPEGAALVLEGGVDWIRWAEHDWYYLVDGASPDEESNRATP